MSRCPGASSTVIMPHLLSSRLQRLVFLCRLDHRDDLLCLRLGLPSGSLQCFHRHAVAKLGQADHGRISLLHKLVETWAVPLAAFFLAPCFQQYVVHSPGNLCAASRNASLATFSCRSPFNSKMILLIAILDAQWSNFPLPFPIRTSLPLT